MALQTQGEGWVWDPDVQLVRDGEDGWHFEYEGNVSIRVWSGRDSAEYITAINDDGTVGLVKFCDWTSENTPMYSPQWRANDKGGVDIPNGDYVPPRGAALVPDSDPLKAPILSLLGQL